MNILLVGEESAGIQMLKSLSATANKIVGVMASPSTNGTATATLWNVATKMGYTTWPAKLVKDPEFAKEIRAQDVDILLNVHSLFIIKGELLTAPRLGSFNLHPGPLPRYAGLNAPLWAIYHGEERHGATIHKMLPELDTGPIAYQTILEVGEAETGLSLSSRCVKTGIEMLRKLVDVASTSPADIPLKTQDLTERTYFGKGVPNGGRLQWSLPAREIVNFVRACDFFPLPSPWGHPRIEWRNREIQVSRAQRTGRSCDSAPGTVGEVVESGVLVASLDEWVEVKMLMVDGKYSKAAELLNSGDQLLDGR